MVGSARLGGLVVAVGVTAALLGCANGDEAACVAAHSARVCAEVSEGRLSFNAEGLEPGSVVRLDLDLEGLDRTDEYVVGQDGDLTDFATGTLGYLSFSGNFSGVVEVRATAADGSSLAGSLKID